MNSDDAKAEAHGTPHRAAPIGDYALISDCRSAALVSRCGSIDWCCMPRFDAEPCFGLMLDEERAGYCTITPVAQPFEVSRNYLEDTMIVRTHYRAPQGSAEVYDLLVMPDEAGPRYSQLLRIVRGIEGSLELAVTVRPRFAFGDVKPWLRRHGHDVYTAVGGDNGLVISADMGLQPDDKYSLQARICVRAGERRHLSLEYAPPENLDDGPERIPEMHALDTSLERSTRWWRRWSSRISDEYGEDTEIRRSAIVLKALSYAPTGAIIAAPTTSLPEGLDGGRTWDYRYSWVRDATFAADALVELGCEQEADEFRRFIERSAAGSAAQLRTLYGVRGGRRNDESTLEHLKGYRGGTPVRIGNHASRQLQLDLLGELLELAWVWYRRGHAPSGDYWTFLVDLVDRACAMWCEPDHGIWEMRGDPQHFVHSKVMCWSALNRGIELAQQTDREAPLARWQEARAQAREAIETRGYDAQRGIFVQTFDSGYLDAALLRMPGVGFIDYDDERMLRTTDAIRAGLDFDGLLRRYDSPDGLPGEEGAFLACSFWLAECLACQSRREAAHSVFRRAAQTANDLGLFAEQYDPRQNRLWSNYPQGLTHLSYINAALALQRLDRSDTQAGAANNRR